jgi:serine/threonine protein kinase
VTVGSPLMVVLEFCEHGSLERYLKNTEVSTIEKHRFAGDVAEGLGYLESIHVVHRDLAARNVLVSSDRRGKISDFGMSRETDTSEFYQSKGGQVYLVYGSCIQFCLMVSNSLDDSIC